ncbi:MAG: hypothetical protein KAT11_06645 [Phycisphaerae bacterium]|nr:hypothetical protein [Phycisphaerae bacterium]
MSCKTKYFSKLVLVGVSAWLLFAAAGCIFGTPGSPRPSAVVPGQVPAPPDWATCTISLQKGQDSADQSEAGAHQSLERIRKQTGWRDLHVVRTDQVSIVCRGYFKSFTDEKAQRTLRQVRSYKDSQGREPFRKAFFAVLGRDQKKQITAGPPEWDLRQAPGNASLCIGFFINDELCKDRLAAAVEKVKKLRKQGVEAWYYHGEYRSGVYVGHFNADWELVTTGKTRDAQPIRRLMFITHDPQFAVLRKKFPKYEENGQVQTYTIGKGQAFDASVLARIPRFGQEVSDTEAGLH